MIICIIGTRAQLIKMAPVILEIEERGLPMKLLFTGQHRETMTELLTDFGVETRELYLVEEKDITNVFGSVIWFLRCLRKLIFSVNDYIGRKGNVEDIILIHGDTLSTLLGAITGWWLRIKVAHIESGLRSFNIFHPFPEEIVRLISFRLSDIAFCPGDWAYENMRKYNLTRINTGENTLMDSLKLALKAENCKESDEEKNGYAVVSIHRFENIFFKKKLLKILTIIEEVIEKSNCKIVFVLHPATRERLNKYGFMKRLEENEKIDIKPRMGYMDFVCLFKNSRFVISDGGSNQEELSYLGIATVLLRKTTERQEGKGETVLISNYDRDRIISYIENLDKRREARIYKDVSSPSKTIVDYLEDNSELCRKA